MDVLGRQIDKYQAHTWYVSTIGTLCMCHAMYTLLQSPHQIRGKPTRICGIQIDIHNLVYLSALATQTCARAYPPAISPRYSHTMVAYVDNQPSVKTRRPPSSFVPTHIHVHPPHRRHPIQPNPIGSCNGPQINMTVESSQIKWIGAGEKSEVE